MQDSNSDFSRLRKHQQNSGAVFHHQKRPNMQNMDDLGDDPFDVGRSDIPTRDRPRAGQHQGTGLLNSNARQMINIDENEDTIQNAQEFNSILERGRRLQERMNDAMGDDAWDELHGPHNVAKSYKNPFSDTGPGLSGQATQKPYDQDLDNIYNMEIEANLQIPTTEAQAEEVPKKQKPGTNQEMESAVEDMQTDFGGRGGNISDMRYIRLKIKTLQIEDIELLQQLVAKGFTLKVSLPLADIYQRTINNQEIKLSNYDVTKDNEFEFTNLSLYNFKVSEETFGQLSQSELKIQIDDSPVAGCISMGKLLLAPNYQLKAIVDIVKTTEVMERIVPAQPDAKSKSLSKAAQKKKQQLDDQAPRQMKKIESKVGQISIELNLQMGDTEEELMRNYKMKLDAQEDYRKKQAEIELLERRKRAVMKMEAQPTFAQLYLHIDRIGPGMVPRQNAADIHLDDGGDPNKRNLFVTYKAFPTLEKLITSVQYGQNEPQFRYRSQFPVLMSPNFIEKLENFVFILEVWDNVSPERNELVGLVKIPLASFCYSLRTTEDDIYSLNFLADQHNMYPMVIVDDSMPIYSPLLGQNVGYLKVMMGLGSPIQVNRQIEKENEKQTSEDQKRIAEERTIMQQDLMVSMARAGTAGTQLGQDDKMQRLIQENDDKKQEQEIEAMDRNPLLGMFGKGSPALGRKNPAEKFANALRQSLQSNGQAAQDYDVRSNSYLNSLRKMFEEVRASPDLKDFSGYDIFAQENRVFTGEVHKDDFIYVVLDKEQFTLTRTEASNICQIMLNINPHRDDKDRLDIDEFQYSFLAYTKYYELISSRVADLLEKIKLATCKRLELPEQIEALCETIIDASTDSKIQPRELKRILEDENGIVLREQVYDQLTSYFDLDRNGLIYIQSVCQYLFDQRLSNFNFFKVNQNIITAHITDYVRNCISSRQDLQLEQLEQAFIEELSQIPRTANDKPEEGRKKKKDKLEGTKAGLLLQERINARVFQTRLKKQGIALSLWEVFTLFEYLNTTVSKAVFYEPQRYHGILFQDFYTLITGKDDYRDDLATRQKESQKRGKKGKNQALPPKMQQSPVKKNDDALQLASQLNAADDEESDIMAFSEANEDDSDEDDYDSEVDEYDSDRAKDKYRQRKRDEKKPYNQIKHVFDIQIKQIQQMPLLAKFIRDLDDNEQAQFGAQNLVQSSYIQNVAVKYSFPLDEEDIYESDYIKRSPCKDDDHTIYNFEVSMNTVHTYKLNRQDNIKNHLTKGAQQLFNISVVLYQNQQEFVIGNAQLPIEDLCDMVTDYEKMQNQYVKKSDTAVLKRVIFLYGTSYSQRENCIIGKIQLEVSYGMLRQVLTKREAAQLRYQKQDDQSCYMHRETYINRKIPLNALLSVYVDRVTGLKESIENIEHFAKINNLPQDEHGQPPAPQKLDRRKILTQILKRGLNLQILSSVFEEDAMLRERFDKAYHQTRVLYNSLNPIYLETFQLPLQMDTKIFDYLKTKRAIFEVRHYLQPNERDSDPTENFLVLGYVRVPLLHLITKNNGIDGDFVILDDYKQKMGTLKLRIALNHHNLQRPLFQGSNRLPKEPTLKQPNTMINQSIKRSIENLNRAHHNEQEESHIHYLGLNFIELIMRARSDLLLSDSRTNQLYLKFQIAGESYMTKFIPISQPTNYELTKLELMTYDLNRTIFIEVDMSDTYQVEQLFAKPLEVQLWHKVTSEVRYHQPCTEEMIGCFFIELNELPKHHNRRVKPQSSFVCYESYFTMYDFKLEKVERERMACRLFLFKKENEETKNDLDHVFNTLPNTVELDKILWDLNHNLDPNQKGFCELEDLVALVQEHVTDKRTCLNLNTLICDNLEFKNSEFVFYSPLVSLPPPYFRYGHEVDSIDLVIKLNQELKALDSHQQGFVPQSLFKQVCDKLRIKVKIADDFVDQMKPNMVDCNITSNGLNVGLIDYVLLCRKLIKSLPKIRETAVRSDKVKQTIRHVESLKMTVRIESAMRLKNPHSPLEPPNSFVKVVSPFEGSICNIETKTVQQSCYPYWMGQNFPIEVPLTPENIERLNTHFLEFEVINRTTSGNVELLGVAFVDISSLYHLNSAEASRMISGYYHVVDRQAIKSNIQLSQVNQSDMSKLSNGQLKVTLLIDKTLQHIKPLPHFDSAHFQAESVHNSPQKQVLHTFGHQQHSEQIYGNTVPLVEKPAVSDEEKEEDFTDNDDSKYKAHQLRLLLQENMSDLDAMQRRMQQTLSTDDQQENAQFGQTQKHDFGRASLATQLHQAKSNLTGVYNPFESKINEHNEDDDSDAQDPQLPSVEERNEEEGFERREL